MSRSSLAIYPCLTDVNERLSDRYADHTHVLEDFEDKPRISPDRYSLQMAIVGRQAAQDRLRYLDSLTTAELLERRA